MRAQFGQAVIELVQGDLTRQRVDAIVNAANSRLAGGGGVDGAIHRAAGSAVKAETERRYPDGCPTGSAVATGGGNLAARYVIHAVGPVYSGGAAQEAELLESAYRSALRLAAELSCESVALPAISTGAYGYPLAAAARIALRAAIEHARENQRPGTIRFVLFGGDALAAFDDALRALAAAP